MTSIFNQISGDACCENACLYKGEILGCSAGVPWLQVAVIGPSSSTVKWINLENGDVVDVKPAGFLTGDCGSVIADSQVCYSFPSGDDYTVYSVGGTKTILKNGTVLTASADIAAAELLITSATYLNLVSCGGEVVPATKCKGAHYVQLTLVAGVAQTITHTFDLGDPLAIGYSVRGVDGTTVGDWPTSVRFINQTADTVDIIADGIGGVVDVALTNTECLSSVVTDGSATSGGGTDSQTLSLTGNTLAISGGNSVDLGDLVPDGCCVPTGGLPGQVLVINPDGSTGWVTPSGGGTDSQTLTLTGTTLAISNGNSVDLSAAIKSGETLTVLGTPTWNSVTGVLSIPYTDEDGTLNTKTVVINPTFVVGNAQDLVGDTTGTVRNTITEVIVGGNTTYTIKSDLPLATSTPNGCPNGLTYDAARGGWYVEQCDDSGTPIGNGKVGDIWSQPWNTTIGTELVVGDYKFRANPSATLNHTQVTAVTGTFEIQAQGQHQTNSGPTAYVVGISTVTAGAWKDFSITANATLNGAGDRNVMIDRTNDRAYEVVYQRTTPAGGSIATTTGQIIVTRLR